MGKNEKGSLLNGVEETEKNFKYVKYKINQDNLNQRIRYRFPKHETIDQLENVFVFDLETCNVEKFAEAYASCLYVVNRLQNRWDKDLTLDEIVTEKDNIIVFDGSNGNPVLNMLNYFSENFEGNERTYIDKDGDETLSSYKMLLAGHKANGFDSWVVLNSLV